MLQGQHHLQQGRNPGGGQGMTNHPFHGADRDGSGGQISGAEGIAQGMEFDRIAQGRARAMGFHIADRSGIQAKPLIDLLNEGGLGRAAGGREAAGFAILIGA